MQSGYLKLNKIFLLAILLIVVGVTGVFVGIKSAKASDKPLHYGYFYNTYFTNENRDGPYVIPGGIDMSVNSKSTFINFIKDRYGSSGNAKLGAAYVIQTMRGSLGGSWDHALPDSADIADWESKINSPNVTFKSYPSYRVSSLNSTITTNSPKDVVEYNEASGGVVASVVFEKYGSAVYALARPCGNPIGGLSGIEEDPLVPDPCDPILITVEPNSYPAVSHTNPNGVSYHYDGGVMPVRVSTPPQNPIGTYNSPAVVDITARNTTGDAWDVTYQEVSSHVVSYTDRYIPDYTSPIYGDDHTKPIYDEYGELTGYEKKIVGYNTKFDRTVTNSAGPAVWYSNIGPCYDYKLSVGATKTNYYAVEAGALIDVGGSISSASRIKYHTKSRPETQWQLVQLVVPPNVSVLGNLPTVSSSDPCGRLSSMGSCSILSSGSGSIGTGGLSPPSVPVTIGDYLAGTKVCFAFGVQPVSAWHFDHVDYQWSHSSFSLANSCIIVVKKPKAQIWAGDLVVNGLVQTSTSAKSINGGRTFGSWAEYGIFASGSISGMASGSAFAGGFSGTGIGACDYSTLSFTNSGGLSGCDITNNPNIGKYGVSGSIADVEASFQGDGTIISDKSFAPSSLESGIYSYKSTGVNDFLTLEQSEIASGKNIIIKTDAKVKIIGNQTYSDGPYNNIYDLPQLIIIANEIVINSAVTNVDAWLVARGEKGTIETCEIIGKTINECSNQLTVNGPVMANELYLLRTYGSGVGNASGDPAEIFNLRADAYLWSFARATISGHVQTVYSTELPPRF